MPRLKSLALLPVLLVASRATAVIVPTAPTDTNTVFRAGENCTFSFERDPTGLWKTVDVDLFSGSLVEMVNVTRVATGLDGTSHNVRFMYECPEVDPPGPIYFYQFSTPSDTNRVWSNRFAIAGKDGIVVKPEHEHQPNGSGEPWGNGRLTSNSSSTSAATSSLSTTSQEWHFLPWLGSVTQTSAGQAYHWQPGPATPTPSIATPAWPNQVLAPAAQPTSALSGFQYGLACSADTACPEETPCCSEFGFCGAGRNCLAGCNPLGSFQPSACAPVPACRSEEYRFDAGTQRILANSSWWNGDAEQYDWLVRYPGKPDVGPVTMDSTDWKSALTLSLTEESNGTTITSTRSILYGYVTARIRSAAGSGILTSFTLLSGTADEILFEFTTNSTEVADTAYFFRGDVDGYKSGQTVNVTNRAQQYHDYTFAWTPEQIVWLVDGVPVRTVSKEDTASGWFDKTYRFPRTPARVRLSIWAAGGADQPENVVEFAGGPISWNSSEYMQKGYYASYVSSVKVDCLPLDSSMLEVSAAMPSNAAASTSAGTGVTSALPSPVWLGWATALPAQVSAVSSGLKAALPAATALFGGEDGTVHVTPFWESNARVRRRVEFEEVGLQRRDAPSAVSSYTYGEVDKDGYVVIHGDSAPTIASNDAATGLDMSGGSKSAQVSASGSSTSAGTGTSSTAASSTPATTSASATSGSTSATPSSDPSRKDHEDEDEDKDEDELTLQESVGAAFAALFLVVLLGWIWRKATSKRAAHGTPTGYFPVGDRNNGGLDEGDMLPSGPMYTGAGPYDASQGRPAMAGVSRSSSTRSSKYAAASGGYVPSHVLQQQYGVSYVPNK
ncbi:hypothetical protein B0A53_05346 [Rhodotorula sp. CCFEE 5036]|nr:hypothetical protein B0A53_05346 [Rhodotorula sp. CCFEE 5036]